MGDSSVPTWATNPIDLSRQHNRRLFAQEFVSHLAPLGASSIDEMRALGIWLFKVPPDVDELEQVCSVAGRLGWVDEPDNPRTGRWQVSELGRTVARPPSLAFTHVFTRLARVAGPVREQATDWLPLLAVVAGALTTAKYGGQASTLDAIRILSLAVLTYALTRQAIGEAGIVRAVQTWADDLDDDEIERRGISAQLDFYNWPRLFVALLFDVAVLAIFGFLLFQVWAGVAGAGAAAILLGALLERRWRRHLPDHWGRVLKGLRDEIRARRRRRRAKPATPDDGMIGSP
jgi:hypothetical protein